MQLCPLAADTPVFASADLSGEPIARLPLGQPVPGRQPGTLDEEDRWRVSRGETLGWAGREALVQCPTPEAAAYVIAPSTVLLDRPGGEGGKGLERLTIGAELKVARGLAGVPSTVVTLLKDGVPIGFVAASDVDASPPDAARLLSAAREALSKADLGRAHELAIAAKAAEKSESGPAAALVAALGDALAGAPVTLPPAAYTPHQPVTAPGPAWIAAQGLGQPARPDSPQLPIGAAVRVLEIRGDRALIGLPEGVIASRVLALGPLDGLGATAISDAMAPPADPAAPEAAADAPWGEIPLSALDGSPPDLARLLEETELARIPGALSAAFALQPTDPAQLEALRDRALRREADPLAVAAVARLSALRAAPPAANDLPIMVEIQSFFGCNVPGAAESARRLGPGEPPVSSPPFPDLPVSIPDEDAEEDAPEEGGAEDVISELQGEACLTEAPVYGECGEAMPPQEWMDDNPPTDQAAEDARMADEKRRYDAEVRAWDRYHAAHTAYLGALGATFTEPRLRVALRNVSDQPTAAARLLLYRYNPVTSGYCGMVGSAQREGLSSTWLDLPPLGPGQTLVLWIPTGDYKLDYGVFVTADEAEAERYQEMLSREWSHGDERQPSEPFEIDDWALDQAAQSGPGGDPCPVESCGC